ncbi:acyltransferase family protein [Muricoccus radiodurans]|uniref:acyltransferase family protein n=1 Tax=Muricoccus radiodurans TaxID=2231721 RepID=UPI003CEC33D9
MQLVSIQYLRAAAALMVVLYHMNAPLSRLSMQVSGTEWLASGVDVFFVISGLIMWVTTAGTPQGPGDFLLRRLVRIVPLYWLLTTLMVFAVLVVPNLVRSGRFDLSHIVTSYLFVPHPHPVLGDAFPILIPGWTLNNEMAFYVLFGLALLLPKAARFWAMGAALLALVVAARLVPSAGVLLHFYGNTMVVEFWFGMALGLAWRAGWLPGPGVGLAFLLGGFALLPGGWMLGESLPRGLVLGVPSALIVLGALALERTGRVPVLRAPLLVGDASYALYLVHTIVLAALGAAWRWAPGPLPSSIPAFIVAGTVLCLAAAIALHLLVDKPLGRALASRLPRRPGLRPVGAPLPAPAWAAGQARAE